MLVNFAKDAVKKVMKITIKAGGTNKFSIRVTKDQVINISVKDDIGVSKTNNFPVIYLNVDYKEDFRGGVIE